jgi:hypothetical protein
LGEQPVTGRANALLSGRDRHPCCSFANAAVQIKKNLFPALSLRVISPNFHHHYLLLFNNNANLFAAIE